MAANWGLHNSLKNWTLYGLTTREVQLLVIGMSINEIRLSKICSKNDLVWRTLSQKDFPDFFQKPFTASDDYPLLPSDRATNTQTLTDVDTDYFVIKKRTELPRLHKRHDIQVVCTIFSVKKNFTTESINISDGGLQFKDLLPEWIAGYFIVGVSSPHGQIQLMCSLVEDQKEKKRVQIVSEDSDPQYMIYKAWLSNCNP